MRNRTTMILLTVFFAAMVVVVLLQNRAMQQPSDAQPTPFLNRVFPTMAVLDIQAIRLYAPNNGRTFLISRATDGHWTAPEVTGLLDTKIASDIAKTVVLMPYQRFVPIEKDTDLKAYGFNPNGYFFIEVLLKTNEQHIIAVGNMTTTQDTYYAIADQEPTIYVVERGPVDFLIKYFLKPPVAFAPPEATPEATPTPG